jgi:hypothetical protein
MEHENHVLLLKDNVGVLTGLFTSLHFQNRSEEQRMGMSMGITEGRNADALNSL